MKIRTQTKNAVFFNTKKRIKNIGKRIPTKKQVEKSSVFYEDNKNELFKILISNKIFDKVKAKRK